MKHIRLRWGLRLTVILAVTAMLALLGDPTSNTLVARAHWTPEHRCGGPEVVTNGDFEATGPATFDGWTRSFNWTQGVPPHTGVGAAQYEALELRLNFLQQSPLVTPVQARCFIYHAFVNGPQDTQFQTVVFYTTGPPDVSNFVHPGDALYRDVSPFFDVTRVILTIEFRLVDPPPFFTAAIDDVSISSEEPRSHGPVGGTAGLLDGSDAPARPAEGSSPSVPYAAVVAAVAGAVALAAGGWYARRRWGR